MSLSEYRTLGRSGLVVSRLGLGTMTFGTARWGTGETDSRAVFIAYVEGGGNFIDTANVYANGQSEEMVGRFVREGNLRESLVIATKAGFSTADALHAGGNGKKHLTASLHASLQRLQMEYVDLFWTHVWDGVTPADEILETMTTLIRAGKIRYWGISNAPAWWISQTATLARLRGLPGPIAVQHCYSLVHRDIEDEHVPLAQEFGLGIVPWSPLAYGLLSGKYDRAVVEASAPRAGGLPREAAQGGAERAADDKRLDGPNPFGDSLFTQRNWKIVDELRAVAAEMGAPPARVALAWVMQQRGVSSTLIGVSKIQQLSDNALAGGVNFSPAQLQRLAAVSANHDRMLYSLFASEQQADYIFGGNAVKAWQEQA